MRALTDAKRLTETPGTTLYMYQLVNMVSDEALRRRSGMIPTAVE